MGLVNFKGPFNFMDLFKLGAGWKDAIESAKIDSESVRNMHVDLFLYKKIFFAVDCISLQGYTIGELEWLKLKSRRYKRIS